MTITSVAFLAFVAVSLIIYLNIPAKYQWWVLLADSLIFYLVTAKSWTIVYLLASVLSVYGATMYMAREGAYHKKAVLAGTIVLNVGMLAVLKYTNLVLGTVNFFKLRNGGTGVPLINWAASLGISFYTLQILAYLLDAYWKVARVEKNPLRLLLFTCYFPLMISGPICLHGELAPELFKEHRFDYERVTRGLRRTAWGICKKVVVADRLAVIVNYLFADPDTFSGIWVIISALLFIFELYFDFSGCMDIVCGVSAMFGIVLPENFKAPFLSKTIQEFWQRWHITLGRWLKSYIMYPLLKTRGLVKLGKSCKKKFGKNGKKIPSYIAMLAVWFLMGLWHGNSWKYVIGEGMWFWLIIVLGQVLEPCFDACKRKLHINTENVFYKAFQVARTLLLYSFGMIFFQAESLPKALYMIGRIPVNNGLIGPLKVLYDDAFASFGGFGALVAVALVALLQVWVDFRVYREKEVQTLIIKKPAVIRWAAYLALVGIIILEGAWGQSSFIYFGF